jgi:ribosomal protein L3 glutamine methyltransferase
LPWPNATSQTTGFKIGSNSSAPTCFVANPPYVSDAAVAAFPPEYAAEPVAAHAGGADGLDIVRRILRDAARHLTPEGTLVVEIGSGRKILERDYPDLPFLWLDTAASYGEVFAVNREALG